MTTAGCTGNRRGEPKSPPMRPRKLAVTRHNQNANSPPAPLHIPPPPCPRTPTLRAISVRGSRGGVAPARPSRSPRPPPRRGAGPPPRDTPPTNRAPPAPPPPPAPRPPTPPPPPPPPPR